MEFTADLNSGSSPKVRKAAEKIIKNKLSGYCGSLIEALERETEKPKAWQTQCMLIKAIAIVDCKEALPYLKQLTGRDYKTTKQYYELGFAISTLEGISSSNLSYLYESFEKGNMMLISGVCAAILQNKVVPTTPDINRIVTGISQYTHNEGRVPTPRYYIAGIAHLWPPGDVQVFLESCLQSESRVLVEIAQNALNGKKSRYKLV